MFHKIVADTVVLIHFVFILFVVLGGFFVFRYRWLIFFHIPAVIWGSLIEFYGWNCPLTRFEKKYRLLAIGADYEGGFVDRYLIPIIYPAGLTRELQIVLGITVVLVNFVAYAICMVRLFRWGQKG